MSLSGHSYGISYCRRTKGERVGGRELFEWDGYGIA